MHVSPAEWQYELTQLHGGGGGGSVLRLQYLKCRIHSALQAAPAKCTCRFARAVATPQPRS